MSAARALLPKEHGAYGQLGFPLVTAFAVAGLSPTGLLLSAAAVAGFLAHEPAAVLLGHRGSRARRELWASATRWLVVCLAAGYGAAAAAVMGLPSAARWSLAVPVIPAAFLTAAMFAGRERSWYGETAAALAFTGVSVPVVLAGEGTTAAALAVVIPFAVLFITSTLAIRVVILRVRGGGNPRAAAATRRAAFAVAAAASVVIVVVTTLEWLDASILLATAPGLIAATLVAARPPSAARLRVLGWSLVAVSTLTALIVMVTASQAATRF